MNLINVSRTNFNLRKLLSQAVLGPKPYLEPAGQTATCYTLSCNQIATFAELTAPSERRNFQARVVRELARPAIHDLIG